MKKFLALLLAVMMIASMSLTAFAADNEGLLYDSNGNNKSTSNVTIAMDGSVPTDEVYYVNVSWKALSFTYSFVAGVTWDPLTHQYVAANDAPIGSWKWTDNTSTVTGNAAGVELEKAITVTNHSNASVDVVAAFGSDATMTTNGVTATIEEGVVVREIGTAEGTAVGNAPAITYDVVVNGAPTTDTGFELGTITVTVSSTNPNP